jgi:16S rRNA (cytidine1402-2'-O)-methyltransferase
MIFNASLYLVPTPIGNLADITFRAVEVLNSVDLILAEDTRNSGRLLKHYDIKTPAKSHHAYNEHREIEQILTRLKAGERMALISDAGTPSISDPGFLLVRAALHAGIAVECLPGATAFVPALVKSGLPSDRFIFEGFLPHKKGRKTRLERICQEDRTVILYESPHRLLKLLGELKQTAGANRQVSVSRELSKLHEETVNGSVEEVVKHFEQNNVKGEVVVVMEGLKT